MLLLRCGADPSVENSSSLTPLDILLKEHADYGLCDSPALIQEITLLCRTMTQASFNRVVYRCFPKGVTCFILTCPLPKVVCRSYHELRPLCDICRQVIRRSLGGRFLLRCQTDLPLPKTLSDYLFQMVS